MPIYSNTDIINSIKEGNNTIGSAFLGYTLVYGEGEDRPTPIAPDEISGLTSWYEASDYSNGSGTWSDKSGNGYTLSISESYFDVGFKYRPGTTVRSDLGTAPYVSLLKAVPSQGALTGFFAISGNINTQLAGATEYTLIQIRRMPTPPGNGYAAWGFNQSSANGVLGVANSTEELVSATVGGQPDPDGVIVNDVSYSTSVNTFSSYRVTSGYNTTNGNIIVDYADTSTSLTNTTNFTQVGADPTTFAINATPKVVIADETGDIGLSPSHREVYSGVYAIWPSILTDDEITGIYNYYKDTYNLA
tara:strand:- start:425 stop:1336 length:912 start_codon:yes stop_codon:yes gene_type:complete